MPKANIIHWELSEEQSPEALELYRSSMRPHCEIKIPEDSQGQPFFNAVRSQHFGNGVISECHSSAQTMIRSASDIRRSDLDIIMIGLLKKGRSKWSSPGKTQIVEAGDIRFNDLSQPSEISWTPQEFTMITLPKSMIHSSLLDKDLHGTIIKGDTGIGRLIGSHISTLMETSEDLSQEQIKISIDTTLALTSSALENNLRLNEEHIASTYRTIRKMAGEYISQNLLDPSLKPESVARGINVSRSTLYRAFEDLGGIWSQIRDKRLNSCFNILLNRVGTKPTINEIAYSHCFSSSANFYRAFQDKFAIKPSEVADLSLAHKNTAADPNAPMTQAQIFDWISKL